MQLNDIAQELVNLADGMIMNEPPHDDHIGLVGTLEGRANRLICKITTESELGQHVVELAKKRFTGSQIRLS